MAFDDHVRRGHSVIFGLIIFCSIVELAISAWLTARFGSRHDYTSKTERDRVHFLLFDSCWTLFFSLFYFGMFLRSATESIFVSVASHGIFLFFTWILWTAGAAAITENLGGGLNCSHPSGFNYCSQLDALEAFAWITWVLVTILFFFVLFRGIVVTRRGESLKGHLVSV